MGRVETLDPHAHRIYDAKFTYREYLGWCRRWFGNPPVITGNVYFVNLVVTRVPRNILLSAANRLLGVPVHPTEGTVQIQGVTIQTKGGRRSAWG